MRCLCVALLALVTVSPARAAEPYRLQIVLTVANQRVLTDVLQDRLERELSDGLQAALGGMARVEVVRRHDLLPEIEKLGLADALARCGKRGDLKTHFLFVDYADPYYRVRGLQHDGGTGQPGPVVRVKQTRDRDFLARLAAKMIEEEFGLTGLVTEPAVSERTTLQLRGVPGVVWSRWVQVGDVFALLEADGEPIPSAYLQVLEVPKDENGRCPCKVVNRFQLPTLTGCQAIKLSTQTGPLRLRLVQPTEANPLAPLTTTPTVEFRASGFDGKTPQLRLPPVTTQRDIYDTTGHEKGTFERLAYVTVLGTDAELATVPVPVLGLPETVVPILRGQRDDPLRFLEESWVRNVAEAYLVQTELMAQMQQQARKPEQRADTIKLAERILARTKADVARLKRERGALKEKPELSDADARLAKLASAEPEVLAFKTRLEEIEAMENDPARAAAKTREGEARLLEAQGELGKALVIYRELNEQKLLGDFGAKIKALEEVWEPKNEEHKAAREFIFGKWSERLTTAQVAENLAKAQGAFAECKRVGDKVGARLLLDRTQPHAIQVHKERLSIRPQVTPASEIELINTVGPALNKLAQDIAAFLKTP